MICSPLLDLGCMVVDLDQSKFVATVVAGTAHRGVREAFAAIKLIDETREVIRASRVVQGFVESVERDLGLVLFMNAPSLKSVLKAHRNSLKCW